MAETGTGRCFLLSLHDVCPTSWPDYREFLQALDGLLPAPPVATHLVVPDFHGQGSLERDPGFCRELSERQARGDELVLHGFRHADTGPVPKTPGDWVRRRLLTHEGEFALASHDQALELIDAGRRLFRHLGWSLRGFVAPGWLYSAGTLAALRDRRFDWYTDHHGFHELVSGRYQPLSTLVWSSRSPWRRGLSAAWNRMQLTRFRNHATLRLALHPVDMRHAAPRRFWLETVRALALERRALTKSALVGETSP